MKPLDTYAQTPFTQTLGHVLLIPFFPNKEVKNKIVGDPTDRPAGRGWRELRGHDSLAGQTGGRGAGREGGRKEAAAAA